MEFVEVMKKAKEMCADFSVCSDCPIYYPGPFTCIMVLFNCPKNAEKAIIDYFRRKENATE